MNWFVVLITLLAAPWSSTAAKCDFAAVFNFGDSNSDTGAYYAAFPPLPPPNGVTYFKKPAGRISDGRLIIDFLAQALGLPYLDPYLKSVGSDFRHGANFAVAAAAAASPPTTLFYGTLFSLGVQLSQFKQFKLQVEEKSNSTGNPLPGPDIFGKSLYTIYIGQNDFTSNLSLIGSPRAKEKHQRVVSQIANTTKEIYSLGGRTFFLFNLAPLGCYPFALAHYTNSSDINSCGCRKSYNNAVEEYNAMLKIAIEETRKQLSDAKLILVDVYAALLRIFNDPVPYGFKNATTATCYKGGASVCSDPQHYVSWDNVHLTEAANKIVADAILSGAYFDPPFPISDYCDIQSTH